LIEQAEGKVERIQIDIVDGKFADNKTIRPRDLDKVKTGLMIDFHLMVDKPTDWITECVSSGVARNSLGFGSLRIIGHIEKMNNQIEFIDMVREKEVQAGLAIDLSTPVTEIDSRAFNKLDMALVMSVKAGLGGQEFDKRALSKISLLRDIRQNKTVEFRICDDGGITTEFIDDAHYVGADEIAIGRKVYKGDMKENIKRLQDMAHKLG
jgi:ribulose-phosphate 3-epimerase